MAGRKSLLLEALDRSTTQSDGGFKNKWNYKEGDGEDSSENVEKDEPNLLSMDNEETETEEQKTKALHSPESVGVGLLKTYARRNQGKSFCKTLKGNATGLNMLGAGRKLSENVSAVTSLQAANKEVDKNRNKYLVISGSSGPGIVVRGRRFHYANAQSIVKTAAQRKEYPADVQRIPMDSISLMGSDKSVAASTELDEQMDSVPDIKRRVLTKRLKDDLAAALPESTNVETSEPQSPTPVEGPNLSEYFSICRNCGRKSEDHTNCENCRKPIPKDALRRPKHVPDSAYTITPQLRPPIHACSPMQPEGGLGVSTKLFYKPTLDIIVTPVTAAKLYSNRNNLLQPNGRVGLVGHTILYRTKQTADSRKHVLNDPIVLSSDDEDDNASTGSSRMDSVHSVGKTTDVARTSPVPSSGIVESASNDSSDGSAAEQISKSTLAEVESTATLSRKAKMRDKFGNPFPEPTVKKRKFESSQVHGDAPGTQAETSCESIILKCRSIRIGTLRKVVLEPVIFSLDFIKVNLGVPKEESHNVVLEASELIMCEWCNSRALPVAFLKLTPTASHNLRSSFKMNKEKGVWYDSQGDNDNERYVVLIFESAPDNRANAIFERICMEIGKKNNIPDFFAKISFLEANHRIDFFAHNLEENNPGNIFFKDNKIMTKYCLRNTTHLNDDDLGSSLSSFTGPIEKLIVYPPPPSKGGISVTNEDLYCLKEGEFLNDVIIDFYLKFLVLEKMKQQDANRIHIFSSFFYKRLNQRERRNLMDPPNLSLPQRRHARVKNWTRHVDLFQKDFVFVPINETAHWFLAVICFPGLNIEPNTNSQENEGMRHDSPVEEERSSQQPLLQEEVEGSSENPTAANILSKTPDITDETPDIHAAGSCESTDLNKLSTRKTCFSTNKLPSDVSHPDTESENDQNASQKSENGTGTESKPLDALTRIQISYTDEHDDSFDFMEDQEYSQEDNNDAGSVAEESSSESVPWGQRPSKQPCILIMDSLRGPSRTNVVKILREYLEVEWEMRKGRKRYFTKDVMKGSNPRVPQQDNFSDCGVYVLQYVESFFENPIPSFELPMNLMEWFPQQRVKKKREEIRNIIFKLCEEQNQEKKGQELKAAEAPS
uniref:Ubiquitin-like protease family profile domain-containing protein n=1 Tax=Callorhinchus milii TaxID=7868 RepID=A0A4W3GY91_CALMI